MKLHTQLAIKNVAGSYRDKYHKELAFTKEVTSRMQEREGFILNLICEREALKDQIEDLKDQIATLEEEVAQVRVRRKPTEFDLIRAEVEY